MREDEKSMRAATICLSEKDLMYTVAGQLFEQAPDRAPRNAEAIMRQVRDTFRKDAYNADEWYTLQLPVDGLYAYVEKLLKGIKEFNDLNLSQYEIEQGINVEDENRAKFAFTSRDTRLKKEHDFIDLDAFISNVVRSINKWRDANEDCAFCTMQESSSCDRCVVNPELENLYNGNREPRGAYTIACKYDCYKSHYICCEECKDVDTCEKKCDGQSATCGNIQHKIDR